MANKGQEKAMWLVSLRKLIGEHLQTTSAPGLNNINRCKTFIGKVFWGGLVVVGFVIVCIQITRLYEEYSEHPIRVTVKYQHNRSLEFPSVTICNLNPIRQSKLDGDEDMLEAIGLLQSGQPGQPGQPPRPPQPPSQQPEPEPRPSELPQRSRQPEPEPRPSESHPQPTQSGNTGVSTTSPEFANTTPTWNTRSTFETPIKTNPPNKVKKSKSLAQLLFNKTAEERAAMGHQLEDMLVDCSWKGTSCTHRDFVQHFNEVYGNCYTFNSGVNSSEILATTKPGPSYGLRLELLLEQDEYLINITETAGMRVVLHNQHIMPFPEEEGFSIPPGMLTAAGFTLRSIQRLSTPHDDCYSEETNGDVPHYYRELFGVDYSMKVCERSCYQSWVITKCDCMDPNYPGPPFTNESDFIRNCDLIGGNYKQDPECMKETENLFANNVLGDCGCMQPCREKEFRLCVGLSLWPANQYDRELFEKVGDVQFYKGNKPAAVNPTHEWLMNNVARLDIYFEQLNYEQITEEPAYNQKNLISDIGGQLGLWIGISLITMFEFFELFYAVFSNLCRTGSSYISKKNKKLISKASSKWKLLRQSSASSSTGEGGGSFKDKGKPTGKLRLPSSSSSVEMMTDGDESIA